MKNSTNPNRTEEIGQRCRDVIYKGDPRIETYRRDAVMEGNPDAVVRPRDWKEASEVLSWCNAHDTPVTVCGSRTSMTGSSVAEEGIVLATDKFDRLIDVGTKDGRPYAIVEPGMVVGHFQKLMTEHGFSYPTVPTSCNEALVGGTVATNATGEDFYKYGPTRNYVREISFLKADGSACTFTRPSGDIPKKSKGLGGYYLDGSEIDRLIGSEGTLGVFTRITVDLLPGAPNVFIILVPFSSNLDALKFIDATNRSDRLPRCLEYIDSYSLSLMKTHKTCPKFSDKVRALVYLKDEADGDPSPLISSWSERIEGALMDETIVAVTDAQKKDIHDWRHHIPVVIGEMHEKFEKDGGGKEASDWWVPREKMLPAMREVYEESEKPGFFFTAFGHLGDGHPHVNYLCRTAKERKKADTLIKEQCRRAVAYGGGVAGEHGLGKIKKDLLAIQYNKDIIAKMRMLKEKFDPKWILGRGNILMILLVAISIFFTLSCNKVSGEIVAEVSGQPIHKTEFIRALSNEFSKYDPKILGDPSRAEQIKNNVLDSLIKNAVLYAKALDLGVSATEDELALEYKRYKSQYTEAAFQKILEMKGIKYDDWKGDKKRAFLIDKLIQQEVVSKIDITDADIKKYYNRHMKEFTHGDEVHARQIVLGDLRKAEEIRTKAVAGENFAALAQEHSIAPEARQGGDLGWFSRGTMPREFDEACFPLPIGDISPVVKTGFGYHIFKVLERRAPFSVPMKDVSDKIIARLRQEKMEEAFGKWFGSVEKNSKVKIYNDVVNAVVLTKEGE